MRNRFTLKSLWEDITLNLLVWVGVVFYCLTVRCCNRIRVLELVTNLKGIKTLTYQIIINQSLKLSNLFRRYVYGEQALKKMADENGGSVICPKTKKIFTFNTASRVCIMWFGIGTVRMWKGQTYFPTFQGNFVSRHQQSSELAFGTSLTHLLLALGFK